MNPSHHNKGPCLEYNVLEKEDEHSSHNTSLNNARRQHENSILEQENTVHVELDSSGVCKYNSSQLDPGLDVSNLYDLNELVLLWFLWSEERAILGLFRPLRYHG